MSSDLVERAFAVCPAGFTPAQQLIVVALAHLGTDPGAIETSLPALARRVRLSPAGVSKALQRMAEDHGIDLRVPLRPTGGRGGGPLYAVPGQPYTFTLAGLLAVDEPDDTIATGTEETEPVSDLAPDDPQGQTNPQGQTGVRPDLGEGQTLVRAAQTPVRPVAPEGRTDVRAGQTAVLPKDTPPPGVSPAHTPAGGCAHEEPVPAPELEAAAAQARGRHRSPPVAIIDLSTGRISYRCPAHANWPVTARVPACEHCAAVRAQHQPLDRAGHGPGRGRRGRQPPPEQRPLYPAAAGPVQARTIPGPLTGTGGDPLHLDEEQLAVNARGRALVSQVLAGRSRGRRAGGDGDQRIDQTGADPPQQLAR